MLFTTSRACAGVYSTSCLVTEFNWITNKPIGEFECFVKLRYRQPDQKTKVQVLENGNLILTFAEKQRAVTIGQFAVLYAEDGMCYGGGKITELNV